MKKSEMRVLIAKDVIKWLKAGKFKARRGVYVIIETTATEEAPPDDADAKTVLDLRNREQYPNNATARMDAICRNLIAHEGVFVASDIPKPRRNPYWTKKR